MAKIRTGRSDILERLLTAVRKAALWVIVLAVLAFGALLILMHYRGATVVETFTRWGLSPVAEGLTKVSTGIKGFFTDWRSYTELSKKYEELEYENEQLKLRVSTTEELEGENIRLQAMLDASEAYSELDPIHASVIGRSPGQWFYTFAINKGLNDGVAINMAVVTGDGLVGYVSDLGYTSSMVTTIIDPSSAVACLVQRTRDNGVMRGEVSSGDDEAQCHVYYLPNVNNIVPGDAIITSGMDSLYPKGIFIGSVTAVSRETSSDGSYAVMAPAVDFMRIEDVLVLRETVEQFESLPNMPKAETTIQPTATPLPDDLIETTGEANWHYPESEATPDTQNTRIVAVTPTPEVTPEPASTQIPILPEDEWAQ